MAELTVVQREVAAPESHYEAYPKVYCPHCARRGRIRYLGQFVGRAQCRQCRSWVDVQPPQERQSG